jgi:hypothetical protein
MKTLGVVAKMPEVQLVLANQLRHGLSLPPGAVV